MFGLALGREFILFFNVQLTYLAVRHSVSIFENSTTIGVCLYWSLMHVILTLSKHL